MSLTLAARRQLYLSHMSAAVAVGDADTQERPQNIVAEALDVARIGADGREVSGELGVVTTIVEQSPTTLTSTVEQRRTATR